MEFSRTISGTAGKRPLVIALHWAGGGEVYKEYFSCLVEPVFTAIDPVIIAPDAEYLAWTVPHNEHKVLTLIDLAKKFWNIDPDKIIITGYSNGGIGSWHFAHAYPDHFAAAIPMAGAYKHARKTSVPLYVIHGQKDELFPVNQIEDWVRAMKAIDNNITFAIHPEHSHYTACAYTEELKKAMTWLKEVVFI